MQFYTRMNNNEKSAGSEFAGNPYCTVYFGCGGIGFSAITIFNQ